MCNDDEGERQPGGRKRFHCCSWPHGSAASWVVAEVVDLTGLDGTFDFDLRWSQQNLRATADPTLSDAPSIFTALREQLGLKLELRRGPRDVVVIDHVERPTPD